MFSEKIYQRQEKQEGRSPPVKLIALPDAACLKQSRVRKGRFPLPAAQRRQPVSPRARSIAFDPELRIAMAFPSGSAIRLFRQPQSCFVSLSIGSVRANAFLPLPTRGRIEPAFFQTGNSRTAGARHSDLPCRTPSEMYHPLPFFQRFLWSHSV